MGSYYQRESEYLGVNGTSVTASGTDEEGQEAHTCYHGKRFKIGISLSSDRVYK